MSHHSVRPKLGITAGPHARSTVTIPLETMQAVTNGVSRALLSLTVLAELFRNGSLGNEEACLPHLLAYIVEGLEGCSADIDAYMKPRTAPINGGDHA